MSMDKVYKAKQLRRALQMFLTSLTDESQMMEVADVYPAYKVDHAYKTGDVFRYGLNEDNETQLYQVLQAHTSASQWTPDTATSLYKKIGVNSDGTRIWTQPLGATDAYNKDDVVSHNGKLWKSTVDANVWEPGVYGWAEVT